MEKLPTLATSIVGAFYLPVLIVTLVTAIYSTTLIFCNGYEAIVVERRLRMDVMGSLYFIGAYTGGFFMAGSFGLFAFYLSEKLVMITQDRSQKSLINVFSQQPRTVWILVDGSEVEVPFESLQANDIVSLHAGQVIPIDGLIEEGNATIDQHMLTGEAQPVERGVDTVMFDKTGPLTLEQPNVARIHICNGYSATEVLTFAAAAEYRQTHPVARAILEEAARQKLSLPAIDHAHYDVGYGLRGAPGWQADPRGQRPLYDNGNDRNSCRNPAAERGSDTRRVRRRSHGWRGVQGRTHGQLTVPVEGTSIMEYLTNFAARLYVLHTKRVDLHSN